MKTLFITIIVLMPFGIIAQSNLSDVSIYSASNDQKFSVLLHTQFYEMGNIDVMDFRLMAVYDVFNNQIIKKVRIEMIFQNELLIAPKINEFNADEIDGMMKTVDYILKSIKRTDISSFDEIVYVCKGGFTVGAFYTPVKKKWTLFLRLIQDDPKSTLHIDADEMAYFKELLGQIKSKFDMISIKDFQ